MPTSSACDPVPIWLKTWSTPQKNWSLLAVSVSEQIRLIWMRRQSAGSRYLTHRSQIRALLRSWWLANCCCYCAACQKPMLKRIVACGTNWRRVLLKRAAKSWVSSATVILVRNWAFWLNRWECMFTFMILKTNCRWATPLRYSIFLTCWIWAMWWVCMYQRIRPPKIWWARKRFR